MDPTDKEKHDALRQPMEAHIERLDEHLAGMEERRRQWQAQDAAHAQEQEARPADTPEAIRARLDAEMRTTIADVQRWVGRTSHPTWIHAAYADLATRLARVEDGLEQLGDSMSLLHSKMEMIIGQLAVHERQDRTE